MNINVNLVFEGRNSTINPVANLIKNIAKEYLRNIFKIEFILIGRRRGRGRGRG
jgi:hypothetical protein